MTTPDAAPRSSLGLEAESLTVFPTADPRRVRTADGRFPWVPEGWALEPPGDALLTRRIKALGPSWTSVEKKGRKVFSKGVWAPAENIEAARRAVERERADPAYAKRLAAGRRRRAEEQAEYVDEFEDEVRAFLRFGPAFEAVGRALAAAVTAHATPVGSGTVARTERIPVERRAEAAVIAWLRHQTTAYDDMRIAREKGARREVRRTLAEESRALLDAHRGAAPLHDAASCPLCGSLQRIDG